MPVISGNTENLSASVESLKEKKGEDLHFSKSLPFTDTSMKMELLSVNLDEVLTRSRAKFKRDSTDFVRNFI